jgi:S-adenosylmethionine:tRNA ribosyltransferase-isomerase
LKTSDFSFDLPEELIAQTPSEKRGASRMLVVDRKSGTFRHLHTSDFPEIVEDDVLLVVNDSKVRKARLFGSSETGGKVEFLLLHPDSQDQCLWTAMVSKAKKQRPGKRFLFPQGIEGIIEAINGDSTGPYRRVRFSIPVDDAYLEVNGHIPLPPYIRREDTELDEERYQTVYARHPGSVAAPTAGLHFTEETFTALKNRSIPVARLTLHVGLGTFLPVRSEEITDHEMHRERYEISQDVADTINRAKYDGRKIVAVGTTSVRTLESAWDTEEGCIRTGSAETRLFIYPGYTFKVVDRLFTNFHTPKSTLLMLVSAFAGKELIDAAYAEALKERYRFFSYGDAMYIQ